MGGRNLVRSEVALLSAQPKEVTGNSEAVRSACGRPKLPGFVTFGARVTRLKKRQVDEKLRCPRLDWILVLQMLHGFSSLLFVQVLATSVLIAKRLSGRAEKVSMRRTSSGFPSTQSKMSLIHRFLQMCMRRLAAGYNLYSFSR